MSLSLQKSQRMPKLKKGIVAYTFLRPNVCEKIHQFLPGTKKMHTKEKWFFFSASRCRNGKERNLYGSVQIGVFSVLSVYARDTMDGTVAPYHGEALC